MTTIEEPFPGFELTEEMVAALTIEERFAPGPAGAPDVRVLLYRPADATGPLPLIVNLHGGGFGLRVDNFPSMDADLALLGTLVVSVDYRSVPHRFPAAPDDGYAALCWAVDTLDIDPERVVVTGPSAGGALAAAVVLMARDRGGPAIRFQALQVPVLDDRCQSRSMEQYPEAVLFGADSARAMWERYLPEDVDRSQVSPYAAPARVESVAGLPPTFISVSDMDPLRDEGLEYAMRLLGEGIPVELYCGPGQYHGMPVDQRTFAQSTRVYHEAIAAAIA